MMARRNASKKRMLRRRGFDQKKLNARLRSKRAHLFEPLEDRTLLAGASIAMFINGLAGPSFAVPTQVIDELVSLGYTGFGVGRDGIVGQDNNILSDWNNLDDHGGANFGGAGAFPSLSIDDVKTFPDIPTPFGTINIPDIPTEMTFSVVDGGTPNTNNQIISEAVTLLNGFSDDDTVVLIGHSLGGDTALKIAEQTTVEIDLLALLDPVGFVTGPPIDSVPIANIGFPAFGFPIPGFPGGTISIDVPDNDNGEVPGLFIGSNLDGSVPGNVKYLYNRWQSNSPFPTDFFLSKADESLRELDGSAQQSLQADFGIADQQPQDSKDPYFFFEGGPLNRLAILAPEDIDTNPFTTTTITVPNPPFFMPPTIDIEVPNGLNPDFLKTDAQLHHDFPQNPTVQQNLIQILQAITPAAQPDRFEENNSIDAAIVLGSHPEVLLNDLTIHEAADVDFFEVTANQTGKLIITGHFGGAVTNAGLRARDEFGNIIATAADDNLVIPVVSQEQYFIEVFSVNNAIFCYELEIENFAAPVPSGIHLDPASDTGMMSNDNLTADDTPRFVIQADLADFEAMGIELDQTPGDPGADVVVEITGLNTGTSVSGNATRLGSTNLWTFTPAASLPDDVYFVAAAVEITDGQTPPVVGRTQLSEPLWVTIDSTAPDASIALDLLASSDSGMFDDDNVTNKMSPAFTGVSEANAIVRVFATNVVTGDTQLVGEGVVGSDLSDVSIGGVDGVGGLPDDGLGLWEVTVEPLADAVYDIQVEFEDGGGNVSDLSEALRIEIDTLVPNTAFLDILESSDSGRHNDDNVTNDNTPTVSMTTEDPNAALHQILFTDNLKFRIFDRFENSSEFLLYDSVLDAAVDNAVTPGDGFTTLEQILETLPDQFFSLFGANGPVTAAGALADGIHNLKLEVEDRAGNISHDFLFDLLIDTVAPPVTILRIDPAFTDTGVEGFPATFVDRVTSDTETGFIGRAEANAIVRLYVDATNNNLVNFPGEFALTVAAPTGGDDAFPDGEWRTSFIRDLNDPTLFPFDRLREVLVEAEDLAGNVNTVNDGVGDAQQSIDLFVDTQGPRITDVFLTNFPAFDLFLQKGTGVPSISMPTPGVFSLTIDVEDFPARDNDDPNFLYEALLEAVAERAGHFVLRGDTSGVIPILDVEVINDPRFDNTVATASIVLSFSGPLPDDRYTLTISDSIVDPVGNALDGETNTIEPQGIPIFPSGDGQPGGDFNVRFTVDSRPEIGTYAHSGVYLDTNGNLTFDPTNSDFVFRDLVSQFGALNDDLFNGNFADRQGIANGFDKLGAYGQVNGTFRFLIDFNGNMAVDAGETIVSNRQVNALAVAGDFAPGVAGDEIGLFDGTRWYLDTTGDFSLDTVLTGNLRGFPIVGDFNGDGTDDLATYQADLFRFDITGDANTDDTLAFGFPGVLDRPVAGDYNLDGVDDLGLFVPNRDGVTPGEVAEWFFLVSDRMPDDNDKDNDNGPITETAGSEYPNGFAVLPSSLFDPFSPTPLGNDVFAQFGDDLAIPLFGNFDPPPAVATADPAASSGVGLYDAVKGLFMLKDEASGGTAESVFRFGPKNSTWTPVTGDWDGDSDTTVGLFDPAAGKFYLTDTNQAGTADHVFRFGPAGAGWTPITGDWDGDGDTTVGLFNPATGTFYLNNENAAGVADTVFRYGPAGAGWTPIVGDWNNDNVDTVGLFDPAAGKFYLTDTNQAGMADAMFRYGPAGAGWTPLAGDWDGDGDDTVGLFDPAKGGMYLRNENASGVADMNFRYGPAGSGWMPSAGDWQGTAIVLAAEAGVGTPEGLAAFASNSSSVGAGSSQAEGPTGILSAVATALASSSSSSSFEADVREAEGTGGTGDQSIDDSLDLALAEVADELLSGGLIDPSV